MEENFEIAFAMRWYGWAPTPGHAVGRDAVGREPCGHRIAAVGASGSLGGWEEPPARDCQAQGGVNPTLMWVWWHQCRDPEGRVGRGTASSSEDLD